MKNQLLLEVIIIVFFSFYNIVSYSNLPIIPQTKNPTNVGLDGSLLIKFHQCSLLNLQQHLPQLALHFPTKGHRQTQMLYQMFLPFGLIQLQISLKALSNLFCSLIRGLFPKIYIFFNITFWIKSIRGIIIMMSLSHEIIMNIIKFL